MAPADTSHHSAQSRMFSDALALVASTVISAGTAVLANFILARLYPSSVVGLAAGMTSTMILLAGVAQLDLTNVLLRFLPRSSRSAKRLILGSYAVATVVSFVVGAIFVLTYGHHFFEDQATAVFWYSGAVALWAVFNLQNQALIGLGAAKIVPFNNAIHGVIRVVLVFAFVGMGATAVFITWVIPVVFLVTIGSFVIALKLFPAHVERVGDRETQWDLRTISRFAAGGYFGSVSGLALANILPLLVLSHLGRDTTGYFYIAWMVASTIDLAVFNFGASLVVQGMTHPQHAPQLIRAAFKRQVKFLGPALIALAFLAYPVLWVFGRDYADAAWVMLTLIAVGLLFRIVWGVYLPAVRIEGNPRKILLTQTSTNLTVLVFVVSGLYIGDLPGIGVGYLIAQILIASVTGPKLWKRLREAPKPDNLAPTEGA